MAQPLTLSINCEGETPFETLGTGIAAIQDWLNHWDFPEGFTISITKKEVKCDSVRYADPALTAIFQECTSQPQDTSPHPMMNYPSGANSPFAQAIWLCRTLRKPASNKRQLQLMYELGHTLHYKLSSEEYSDLRRVMGWTLRQFNEKIKAIIRAFRLYSLAGDNALGVATLVTPAVLKKMKHDDFEMLLDDILAHFSLTYPTDYDFYNQEQPQSIPSSPSYTPAPYNDRNFFGILLDAATSATPI